MKKSVLNFVSGALTIVILSTVAIGQTPVVGDFNANRVSRYFPAGIIWSENFDGGDISNWNFFEINWTLPLGVVNLTANPYDLFNVSEGVLRAIGPEWNTAAINSTIAYGTWTFDLDMQRAAEYDHFAVELIGEKFNETWLPSDHTVDGYRLSILIPDEDPDGVVRFVKGERDKPSVFLGTYSMSVIRGWHNFIITRELTGQFHVYMDGIHIIEALDNTTIRYEQFCFFTMANPAIDNITISDTIDFDKAPPTLYTGARYQTINQGEPFRYDLNATDPSGVDTWWIDDTENFTINQNGVITNNTALSLGEYDVGVWVNDTQGYTRYYSFTLSVVTSTTTNGEFSLPIELILVVGGGIIVIIIILVVLTRRHR